MTAIPPLLWGRTFFCIASRTGNMKKWELKFAFCGFFFMPSLEPKIRKKYELLVFHTSSPLPFVLLPFCPHDVKLQACLSPCFDGAFRRSFWLCLPNNIWVFEISLDSPVCEALPAPLTQVSSGGGFTFVFILHCHEQLTASNARRILIMAVVWRNSETRVSLSGIGSVESCRIQTLFLTHVMPLRM